MKLGMKIAAENEIGIVNKTRKGKRKCNWRSKMKQEHKAKIKIVIKNEIQYKKRERKRK